MKKQTLLIIDDSPDIHDLVQVWLAGENIDFLSCYQGEKALDLARQAQPDLVLLDVDLPGLNGFEICKRIKADPATKQIPVVFVTGADATEEKLQGLEAGANDYVIKPFDPAELRARVRSALHTKQLLDELAEKAVILAESEERFRVLAENSSDVIWRLDPSGVQLYVSPASRSILGYPPQSLESRSLIDFVHPEDAADVSACYGQSRGAAETGRVEFRFRSASGNYVWLESTCRTLCHADSTAIREVHASARDITGRKQADLREEIRADVLQMIAQDTPLPRLLQRLIDEAERQEPQGVAAGVLLDGPLACHCAPRLPESLNQGIEAQLTALVAGFNRLSAGPSQRVVICDLQTDPAWEPLRPQLIQHGLRSCWAIVIRTPHGDACGAFALYRQDHDRTATPAVTELLKLVADLTQIAIQHRQLSDQLTFQAHHDALTHLPNRALFSEQLPRALATAKRTGRSAAALLVDVDHFKYINDSYGHQAGDELLCQVARRLRNRLRDTDMLARMGGDEFAILLVDLAQPEDAARVAASLVEAMHTPLDLHGRKQYVSLSIGSATYPQDATDPTSLLKNADLALYCAKDAGRNTSRAFVSHMGDTAQERVELESSLRVAVSNGELRLHYQPKVDGAGQIASVEALLRWQHPTLGLIPPAKFIPVAEDTGMITQLGEWVLRESARQLRAWMATGLPVTPISVNVSAVQFARADFLDVIAAALADSGVTTDWLELELTESLLMRNMHDASQKLAKLREMRVRVAVDDFGTGYSSLAYLHRLSIDTLKIDRSFVRELKDARIDDPAGTARIVSAIVALAKNLGLQVVAEGVEDTHQRELLLQMGCDLLQGYWFSPAAPAAQIEPLLRKQLQTQAPQRVVESA